MGRSYKTTGINLKGVAIGESDRLLTVLTKEQGIIRVVAPGARKHQSSLRGRSELFVVNHLLVVEGRSLDKVIQAETIESFPKLSQDLWKLTAGQYLIELVLGQALSHQPQEELFQVLCEHLYRLERFESAQTLAILTHAIFHLLRLAGVAPEVHQCCISREPLIPNFADPDWRIGFHPGAGGTVTLVELDRLMGEKLQKPDLSSINSDFSEPQFSNLAENGGRWFHPATDAVNSSTKLSEAPARYPVRDQTPRPQPNPFERYTQLDAFELSLLQQLSQLDWLNLESARVRSPLPSPEASSPSETTQEIPNHVWLSLEKTLRYYAQYHFERSILSASLIDTSFSALL